MSSLNYTKVYVQGNLKGQKVQARMLNPTAGHIKFVREATKSRPNPDHSGDNKWYAINIKETE